MAIATTMQVYNKKVKSKYKNLTYIFAPLLFVVLANQASAGIFSDFKDTFKGFFTRNDTQIENTIQYDDLSVLRSDRISFNSSSSVDSEDSGVMRAVVGQLRNSTEEEKYDNDQIGIYEVKEGDTVSGVADLYGVSKNTIVWANDIKGALKPGQTLIILPVTGVKHIVKKGDTLASIAKKYKADTEEIALFNGLSDSIALNVGDNIIIPEGEVEAPAKAITKVVKKIYNTVAAGYYVRPIIGGHKTQGIHGHNGIDIGAPIGTPILASADGTVSVARDSGYNGGYGDLIIISHSNGTQTVYAHLNSVYVKTGQKVVQGEQIGTSGNTGRSTGPHLHFEIRGATNPF